MKGISNLGRNEYLGRTVQSIFQSDTAEESVSRNTLKNLPAEKDRRELCTEKSVALLKISSKSLSKEGPASDFSCSTTSLPILHQQSFREQKESRNRDISQQNINEHSGSGVRGKNAHHCDSQSITVKAFWITPKSHLFAQLQEWLHFTDGLLLRCRRQHQKRAKKKGGTQFLVKLYSLYQFPHTQHSIVHQSYFIQ